MYNIENPKYKKDYKPGQIFFSFTKDNFISKGISVFTNFERKTIRVSHCGIIISDKECLEAAQPGGVQVSNFIEKYVQDPHTIIYVREPRNLTKLAAKKMEIWGKQHVGKDYAVKGFIGSSIYNLLGLTFIPFIRKIKNPMNSDNKYFCSELVAECLIKAFPDRPGILRYHPSNIYPQGLFEDNEIFLL